MRTRSSSNLPVETPLNPSTSNPKRRNCRRSKQPFILEESPVDTMADQRTMAELLRAPIEGYAEAIVVTSILAEQFELKHSLINMMTSDQFFGLEKDNPHDHIRWFNKITSTIKYKDVPNSAIKLMLFPFSLAEAARSGSLPSNTVANPKGELKDITTRSGIVLDGSSVPIPPSFINPEEDERVEEILTDQDLAKYTIKVPPPLLHINITLADALILIPKYQKMFKALLSNKEKFQELANTPLNENCSTVILKKLPEKLGDPEKFLIPCGFSELKCKALADLGASINLMPLFVWNKLERSDTSLSLPEYEIFIDYTKETNSGSTITHVDYSLPKYDSFLFEIEPDQGKQTSIVMKDNLAEPQVHVPNVLTTHPTLMLDFDFVPFDNSLPEFKTFYFDIEDKNSGSTIIHADISLSDLESFNFDFKPDPSELTSIVDFGICENILSATNVNLPPEEDHSPLFAYVVWIFIAFLTNPMVPPHLFYFGNEDTIFDPGIANHHFPSLLLDVSHRCETFMKFNDYLKLLNENPMEILSSSCSLMEQ
nr:reverse transcriptase domain-containing protein [Tanacetum cinerariifolium]